MSQVLIHFGVDVSDTSEQIILRKSIVLQSDSANRSCYVASSGQVVEVPHVTDTLIASDLCFPYLLWHM